MRTWIAGLAAVVLALDQATKWWMLQRLTLGESLPLLPGIFHLTLVRNPGIAFGLFAGQGGMVLGLALLLVAVLVVTVKSKPSAWPLPVSWAMGLILGGALGNLLDRLRFGAVVDFLDFRVWPVFNLADSAITIGAALILWAWWRDR
ncbi:MAG: signal peptidase II [Omnitrophica WOR_2 bacterium RIFCSPHIGHO2_02_FULL_68_15]|nr:MAG: signal peptidase II [Omnitrophica WOR_2 bacterium RIFCSPHIGHO2_02_FULL_68_15]